MISEQPKVYSLLQVAQSIRKTLNERYGSTFWVRAEMNKLNFYKHSGHCYPELVEKKDGKVVALLNGILWSTDFKKANAHFLDLLGEPLHDGIKIMFLARINFDPAHGLSLQMLNIDPAYTLGDLQREKAETVAKLEKMNLLHSNRTIALPLLPLRIAVISVESSKGYADFMSVLTNNSGRYAFFVMLFPSLLQGDRAATNLMQQLKRIEKVRSHFDAVAIIRGGGGDVGLSCYNDFALSRAIAEFPLPVLSGIGHATNETVAEIVSHFNGITPTKVAEYLISKVHLAAAPAELLLQKLPHFTSQFLQEHKRVLRDESRILSATGKESLSRTKMRLSKILQSIESRSVSLTRNFFASVEHQKGRVTLIGRQQLVDGRRLLHESQSSLETASQRILNNRENEIMSIANEVRHLSPENVLKRGFSLTAYEGKPVTSISQLQSGAKITTYLHDGSIQSIINRINNE